MEFTAPGVQARDRGWKRLYCILRGTQLLVYKFDPHRFPLKAESPSTIPTISQAESEEYLHVHVPGERRNQPNPPPPVSAGPSNAQRGSVSDTSSSTHHYSGPSINSNGQGASGDEGARRASVSSANGSVSTSTSSEKDARLFSGVAELRRPSVSTTSTTSPTSAGPGALASHFQHNQLVKQYTLQNAESGLAADYVKRKNVVRVRSEGEQFLLQTDDARDVVDWIEVS